MKEVKHHVRRRIPFVLILLLCTVFVTAILCIWFFLISPAISSRQVIPVVTDDEDLVLFECDSDQLFSVMITPRNSAPYTLSWHDGAFLLEEDAEYPLRQGLLADLSVYATYVNTMGSLIDLAQTSSDPDGHTLSRADFGLDPAAYTAVIRTTDGSGITLYFGDYFEDGTFIRYYMATDKDDTIYVVSSDFYDAFSFERHLLHTVQQPSLNSDLLDSITITGETTLTLARMGDYWFITSPVRYPADEDKTSTFLSAVNGMLFSSWVGEKDDLDLSAYGLDNPRLTITFGGADTCVQGYDENDEFVSVIVPGKDHTLLIGKDASSTENVSFYCMYEDTVFIGTYFTLGFLTQAAPKDFCLTNPVSYASNAIDQVTFTSASASRTYDIELIERVLQNGELEKDPQTGEQVYTLQVTSDQTPVDSDTFLVWYNKLTQLNAAGWVQDGYIPKGDPLYTIRLSFGSNTREIHFYQYDALHLAYTVDGVCLCYLAASEFDSIETLP